LLADPLLKGQQREIFYYENFSSGDNYVLNAKYIFFGGGGWIEKIFITVVNCSVHPEI
jgi:hypothetical protein